ncbi:DNA-3-methyladenine glycosylase family protein [Paenibacillus beijingensis]|uniref:DNA-3-methyladenine glycosylase family protein n=1 Tax=Paenibacillus beijingensis TaxID=1126833 RepID=UPI00130EB8AD|nr:DNA-3-methyladenine glycosylase 2 family protein [Paenibacillus beijingensis]
MVERVGSLVVPERANMFEFLAKSLIGQQLSVKAAATIIGRLEELCRDISPDSILSLSEDELRKAGVSRPKIGYIKGLAGLIERRELDFGSLPDLADDEVIESLTKVKGIGRWTAEMFLIFFLGREDVLSLGDAGLRRAVCWLYEDGIKTAPGVLERHGEKWRPYRTVASLYLWEAVNRGHVKGSHPPAGESIKMVEGE